MQRDHRRGLTCPVVAGWTCPTEPCPGGTDPEVCRHLDRLRAWQRLPTDAQSSRIWAGPGGFEPSTRPDGGRLRVGLWCPCLGLGGAEVWQLALGRAVDPALISWKGAAVLEGRSAADPRMARELESIMPVGYGREAARSLASVCDVVVSWAVTSVPDLLSGIDGPPPSVVVACHFPGESPWGPGTEAMLSGVDRFVGVSELAVESIPGSIRDRVEVIWNAVDERRLAIHRDRSTMRAAWGVPPGAIVAGFLGRLSPEKDPGAMIRLAEGLPEPWHVVLVGEGRERASLLDAVESRGLDRVHLVGGDLAAGDVLNGFDTLVVPSRFESFGLSLAEGLWAGLPVVATRSGLAKLRPGLVREVVVGAGSVELARAVLDDRADPEGTTARVEMARTFALDRLSVGRFGRDWTRLLMESGGRKGGIAPCMSSMLMA